MSVIVKQTINIDLTPGGITPFMYVSQGDYGTRALEFNLYQNNTPFVIPETIRSVTLEGITKSGYQFSLNCEFMVGTSTVIGSITADMTDTIGLDICQLALFDSQNDRLGSANFFIAVEQSPLSTKVMYGTIYWSELSKSWAVGGTNIRYDEETNNSKYWCEQVSDARYAIDLNKTQIRALQEQINQYLDPPAEHVGEVVNARIGYDGTVYESLGDAIRSQATKFGYISENEEIYFSNV